MYSIHHTTHLCLLSKYRALLPSRVGSTNLPVSCLSIYLGGNMLLGNILWGIYSGKYILGISLGHILWAHIIGNTQTFPSPVSLFIQGYNLSGNVLLEIYSRKNTIRNVFQEIYSGKFLGKAQAFRSHNSLGTYFWEYNYIFHLI